jgi:hypothetical protein
MQDDELMLVNRNLSLVAATDRRWRSSSSASTLLRREGKIQKD